MKRTLNVLGGFTIAALLLAVPASAQVVQSVQFGAGGFFPKGLDGRDAEDVIARNYFGETMSADPSLTDALAFDIKDFRSGHAFGEWNVSFGPHIEVGAGIGVYGKTVPTVYLDVVDENNRDIDLQLRLRVVPITGVVRFLPFGNASTVQPYVGVGVSALNFRYSEIGDFVDPTTLDIFSDRFTTTGTALGGLVVYGLRLPIGGDIYGLTLEGRTQFGKGNTGGADKGFLTDKIDLGGSMFNVGFLVRF